MGQDLFYPPNVGGWIGGRSWLSTRTAIARSNYATTLAEGRLSASPKAPDLPRLLGMKATSTAEELLEELVIRIFGGTESPPLERLQTNLNNSGETTPPAKVLVAVLTCPGAHLN
jgi:hypothetical protein